MNRQHMKTFQANRGVTLIEVLVTVLVMSIGLLGLAALQGVSLQAGQGAYHRTQATNIAYEVADFVRLNRSAAISSCSLPVVAGWNNFVAAQLPGGTLAVTFNDCDAGEITVQVNWVEQRLQDADQGGETIVVVTRI
jgi:type IV pilus assembly protein PilV